MSIYIIIGVAVVFGIIFFINNVSKEQGVQEIEKKERENIGKYYYLKKSLFTPTEYAFFKELQKQNNNEFMINSKVRLEDIVGVGKGNNIGKRFREMRNHIKSRHVDFVIVSNSGDILAAIELDDRSHNTEKAKIGDQIKDDIFGFVGSKFYRVRVGETYSERIESIFTEIKRA